MNLGQMFLLGFDGCSLDDDHWLRDAIMRQLLGGVILFDRNVDGTVQNISSPAQLKKLTTQLQKLAADRLLIAVDQEGGMVCRLKERDGFPSSTSATVLGRDDPASSTAGAATVMAATLAANGINLNLAPVVDLDCNPANPIISRYERSFSSQAGQVVAHAQTFIRAHHKQGVACCLKHFPGHGSARGDSHLGFVDISDDWQPSELDPYRQLFATGFSDAVMTAHLLHRGLDSTSVPATLSPVIINSMLRKKLRFDGVIMSDDLQMRAIADSYGYHEAIQRAVLAGVDLMIVGNNLVRSQDALARGITAIQELLDRGAIDGKYINRSINRISVLKQKITGELPWTNNKPTPRP